MTGGIWMGVFSFVFCVVWASGRCSFGGWGGVGVGMRFVVCVGGGI